MMTTTSEAPRAGLAAFGYYVPKRMLNVEEWAGRHGVEAEAARYYRDTQGLPGVYVSDGESAADMAVEAGRSMFRSAGIDPTSVDRVLMYHTLFTTSLEPRNLLDEVRERLAMSRATGFAVTGQYCSSIITAMRLARNMIACGSARRVMLIGVDHFIGSLKRDIPGITLQGEGASAALVEANPARNEIVNLTATVEGSFFRGVHCSHEENERFNFLYFLTAQRLVRQALQRQGLASGQIRLIVPHNINWPSWDRILRQTKLPRESFFGQGIASHGHVCGSDLMINLCDALSQEKLQIGEYALLLTVGLGACWGCAILRH